jgi:predicted Zn-ribbon and HTH transcriptional regulator
MKTNRQKLAALLERQPWRARDLSRQLAIKERDVYDHLSHIQRSAAAAGKTLHVTPCSCRRCGFVFKNRRRLTRPGRCPECRSTYIEPPVFKID